jgi:disulfide bond formation protein DsbB
MWENRAMQRHLPRIVFAAIFATCIGLDLFAIYYLQEWLGLEPCPMCILQRYAYFAIAGVALVGAIWNPRGKALKTLAALVVLFAILGGGVAARHSYIQHYPPKIESCGTDLEGMINTMPLGEVFPKIFQGTGSCSTISWKFLGLSIPEWGLVWFVIYAAVALWLGFLRKRRLPGE